jgi:hypothetical protein
MRRWLAPARRAGLVAAAGLFAAAAGCEKPRGDVSGKVSYKGKPVAYGTVNVIASDQMTYYGVIHADGTYAIQSVPTGPIRLGVYSPDPYFEPPVPPAVKAAMAKAREKAEAEGKGLPRPPKGVWVQLPAKYADPVTSDLTGDVTAPTSVIDCQLN